ncbi:beta-lactamase family protein [Kribbella sandramycini]|uniref:Beta-lactamase family protein n=1 Tax=Kribbella sandramycini TaxID=60450 RepID=A0A7Y4KVL4_9ACTN|nr:serine hydrolase domain-containing protein [Kribbella sandramycini]MBB6567887.1 D-alanyl-D-alanine carboxypeptidase [Kribbella sandramycini]NOL39518.1 beta-lactamase family protein [Kribbella sandramycini]
MRKQLFAAVLTLAALAAPLSAQAGRSTLQKDADAITATGVTGVLARSTTPHGSRTAVSGVSVLGGHAPRPDGRFRIGSTNKVLVGTVVLQLVAERRLRLEDPVEKYLPGLVQGDGYNGHKITIRQLLQHTAGIYDGNFPSIESAEEYYERRYRVHTEEEIVKAGLSHPPESQPGDRFDYSNTGYDLVGLVIKAATGRTWHEEVDRRIVRPLRLRDTYFPRTNPRIAGPHAHSYTRFTPGVYTDTTELIDADASGGYISTLKDLDRIVRSIFDGKLLKPAQLRELKATVPVSGTSAELWPDARYGLGVFSRSLPCGGTIWMPSGDQIGFRTRTAVTADGKRSVVLSMSSQLFDSPEAVAAQEKAASKLIDDQLCR